MTPLFIGDKKIIAALLIGLGTIGLAYFLSDGSFSKGPLKKEIAESEKKITLNDLKIGRAHV